MASQNQQIRYLTAVKLGNKNKKYCRFKKMGIKFNKGTGQGSKELSGSIVNKVSPVATTKKNK